MFDPSLNLSDREKTKPKKRVEEHAPAKPDRVDRGGGGSFFKNLISDAQAIAGLIADRMTRAVYQAAEKVGDHETIRYLIDRYKDAHAGAAKKAFIELLDAGNDLIHDVADKADRHLRPLVEADSEAIMGILMDQTLRPIYEAAVEAKDADLIRYLIQRYQAKSAGVNGVYGSGQGSSPGGAPPPSVP